jgi:glucosamine--fructose-6-phosphate aminotransferase (isomerizing)
MTTDMLQEIGEASDAVAPQLGHNTEGLAELAPRLRAFDPTLVATIMRGSSNCCALQLKYPFEIVSGVPCTSGAVSVAISQSGPSPDIVEIQSAARRAGALQVAYSLRPRWR